MKNTIDPLASPEEWDQEVSRHADATVFHTSAWARILAATYRHKPFYLRFPQASGTASLVPVMEVTSPLTGRRGVGLPFSDFCSPLLASGADLSAIRTALEELCRSRRWKHVESRGGELSSVGEGFPGTFYGHQLKLEEGVENLWKGLAGSVRQALRKAGRAGLKFRLSHEEAGIKTFYELHRLTRLRHGVPPQPYTFFRNFCQEKLIGPESGFVAIAESKGKAVAASVFLRCGAKALYKFGASDESAWEERPNHLVMWRAMEHLVATRSTSLHFGRTSLPQDGLRRFKMSWGAEEKTINYLNYAPGEAEWRPVSPSPGNKLMHYFFQHLSPRMSVFAGKMIYAHLD